MRKFYTFLIRTVKFFQKFLIAAKNLGLLIAVKIFFFSNKNKINYIKSKNYPHNIYYRKNGDYGVLGHLYDTSYKINDNFSDDKIATILDLGANIGIETIKFKKFYPNAKIISLEPEINNFAILKSNTEKYDNIFIENCAISNKEMDAFIVNNADPSASNYHESFHISDQTSDQKVKTTTIEKLIKKYDLKRINILKSDIEGYEKYLFDDSCQVWLSLVDIIIFECPDNDDVGAGVTQQIYHQVQKNKLNYKSYVCGECLVLIKMNTKFKLDKVLYF
jgi:FkbM family methyltransferase